MTALERTYEAELVLPFCCRCFRVSTDAAGHQSLQINIVYWTYLVNPGPSTAFAVPVGTYAQTNGLLIWSYQTTYMGSGSTRRQCCLLNAPCLNLDKSIGPEEASDEGERMSLTSLKSYCALPLAGSILVDVWTWIQKLTTCVTLASLHWRGGLLMMHEDGIGLSRNPSFIGIWRYSLSRVPAHDPLPGLTGELD